ncbi:hypothetical protein [Streptantibioticus silvisoli]|uniref:Nucleotidyltransferase domain-containing protein n=1 Tax=Streptantibioticus silvisoli TaxID=2705255 RepID=A0ABT6VZ99_9ACTN|nr:hypothetical protein [Streptantibioticus silvisoli]MDI5962601.1 hypothetical protein [Streptantibioticus silvisoli]
MFTGERREQVTALLLERARSDERITGAAITGSTARGAVDRWSDLDLFLGVADPGRVAATAREWTAFAHRELGALHHFELRAGAAVYVVLLLGDLLEVDLGFTPADAFGPLGAGAFHTVFGDPAPRAPAPADPGGLAGHGWHHVLHAAAAVDRGQLWRAAYWINSLRDRILDLACVRHDLPVDHAKGADRLPPEVTAPLLATLVAELTPPALRRSLRAATAAYLTELRYHDAELAASLTGPLTDRTTA